MDIKIKELVQKNFMKKRPDIKVGDTVKMHLRIKEGDKERIQVFQGLLIAISGSGINKTATVRKISYGVGVEKIIPIFSPLLDKIEVIKRGKVRRSKLYFMRERVGKKALKVGKIKDLYLTDEVEVPVEGEVEEQVENSEEIKEEKTEETKEEKK